MEDWYNLGKRKGNIDIMAAMYSEKGIRSLEQAKRMEDVSKKYGVSYCTIEDKEEALKGVLSKGGRCAAFLPCGLDQVQPKSNLRLAERILEYGGCLLSEYPVGTIAERYRYVERDRLQSGVSQGVLMIEAEEKSGTMHTINYALKQRKRLACYYHGLLDGASGNRYLESLGKAQILKTEEELSLFIDSLLSEEEYEQLSFEFLV